MVDKIVTEADQLKLRQLIDGWYAGLTVAETTPMPPPVPAPPRQGWNSGVWAEHNKTEAEAWFAWLGRGPGLSRRHVTAFVTHAQNEAAMTSPWWQAVVPSGTGLSLRVPLVPAGDKDLKKNRAGTFRLIARQAFQVDPNALICPAWEMNLPGWSHSVNAGNMKDWKDAWERCYDTMKTEAPTLNVGFNPNGGDVGQQVGVDIRAVFDGLDFDSIGPDQYDCWPGILDTVTAVTMMNRPGGLVWWQDIANDHGVPLIVPEWGVSSGSQWAGHTGGDNPLYIKRMFEFFTESSRIGAGLLAESYFNGSYPDLRGDIFRLPGGGVPANPKAAAAYHEMWRNLP